jgi:hypothetical protein
MNSPRIDGMTSSDLRDVIVSQHVELRTLTTAAVQAGDRAVVSRDALEPLRAAALALYDALAAHMDFEEQALGAALGDVVGWGEVIHRQMQADHGRQRESLAAAISAVGSGELTPLEMAASVHAFAQTLLADMESEERGLLEADLDALITETRGG